MNKKQLKIFIKKTLKECIIEIGPSAQGIVQPWLGPTFLDDEGVPIEDQNSLKPLHLKKS